MGIRLVGSTVEVDSPCRDQPLRLCSLEWAALSLLACELASGNIPADAGVEGGPFEVHQAEVDARRVRAAHVERELLK